MEVLSTEKTKLKIKKINSFELVEIKENSLVLCDIDDTVLRFDLNFDDFYFKTKKHIQDINNYIDEQDMVKIASKEFSDYRDKNTPFHTDKNGFDKLEKKISDSNSKLYFITSRSEKYKNVTEEQFKLIGIDHSKYPIYFTFDYKMSKADFIEKYIDISNFSQIYFIDDLANITKQVKKKFPEFECFIYKYDK